ncbi:hypothetical protein, partial [Shewanella algae]|uniref:hypothetical protein n=1 Tax=Shewanella algae TaxID=38313 RepID=UPI0031F59861
MFLLQCSWGGSAAPATVCTWRPGTGLDGQELQLGPGCFYCSVPGGDLRRRQRSAPGAQVPASMAKSCSWARGISAAVFLGEICGAGNGQHQVSASMAKSGSWARGVSAAVFLGELRRRQWSAPGAQVPASMAKSGSWARGISAAVFLGEICGAGNGQHQVSASMAKSGSWARGISAAVFLGEICGAGNGQHQVSASMAKS